MSTDLTPRTDAAPTRAPQLLVFAVVPLIAFMALAHTTIEGDSASTMTPAQIDDTAAMWLVVAILWVLPVVLAAIAFSSLAARVDRGASLRSLAGAGIALLVGHVVAQAAVVVFDDSRTLADSTTYAVAILLSLLGWWVVDVVAALTCYHLYRSRGAGRKTSAVVGVLTVLFMILEIAIYLPALIGSQELHDTIGLPPMLLPIVWAVLGGVLWRARD